MTQDDDDDIELDTLARKIERNALDMIWGVFLVPKVLPIVKNNKPGIDPDPTISVGEVCDFAETKHVHIDPSTMRELMERHLSYATNMQGW